VVGHALRPRQLRLLDLALPRIRLTPDAALSPLAAFPVMPRALWLEIGFGGGEHALAQIATNPELGLIACEVFANGICSLLSRLVPEGEEATAAPPANLLLWPDDARRLLPLLPANSLDGVFLLFPDPWPKARHARRRFVHPDIVPHVARVVRPGGEWRIASDDPVYQHWVDSVMAAQPEFRLSQAVDSRPAGWPPTRYEAKALRTERRPRYWSFIRRG
jgi:tRNA (guanine-N7-)-methyltransferase